MRASVPLPATVDPPMLNDDQNPYILDWRPTPILPCMLVPKIYFIDE